MDLLAGIREANDRAAALQRQADEWTDRRDDLIRQAISAGIRVPLIADAAGVNRSRIYQIRDGRR